MPEATQSRTSRNARQQLLDAGLEILKQDPRTDKLSVAAVSRQAGVTRRVFYRYWANPDDYLRDVLAHGLSGHRARYFEKVERMVPKLIRAGASVDEIIVNATRLGLSAGRDDPTFTVQMSLWTRHAVDPKSRDALGDLYADFHAHFLPLFRQVLDAAGLELQPPWTLESFAVTVTALAEGLVLQRRVRPAAIPDDLLTWALLALAAVVVQPKPDRDLTDDLRDRLKSMSAAERPAAD